MTALTAPVALPARLARTEIAKGLRLMSRRWPMVVVGGLGAGGNYLGISFFAGGGHLVKDLMRLTVPAMLATVTASIAAIQGTGGIAEEVNGGTLEQSQLSPAGPRLQALGRLGALAVEGVGTAAALGIAFVFGVGLHLQPHPAVLLPVMLTIVDALGYALIMTALVVRVASIGAITHVFNMVIMAFGGMLVPIAVFPHGLEIFARFVPTALGVQGINTTLTHGISAAWSDDTLPWLVLHSAAIITVGFALYAINIRRAQREGGLSPR
jgi:ABC-2 type transport system permease protein